MPGMRHGSSSGSLDPSAVRAHTHARTVEGEACNSVRGRRSWQRKVPLKRKTMKRERVWESLTAALRFTILCLIPCVNDVAALQKKLYIFS